VADSIFKLLSEFFARYGYWAVFLGVMMENAGLPIPGETVVLFAGFLAYQGKLGLVPAIVTAIAAATLGNCLGFWLGHSGGAAFVDRFLKPISWIAKRYDNAQKMFVKYGAWAVFFSRFVTGLRVFAGILAGVFKMSFPRFLLATFAGAICWAVAIGCAGYFFGSNWGLLVTFVKQMNRITLVIVAAGVVLFFVVRRIRRKTPA
jgi:membrane-associated protein